MLHIRTTILSIGLICLPLNLSGQTKAPGTPSPAAQLREIADLRQQITALQKKLEELDARVNVAYTFIGFKQDRRDSIDLTLSDPNYLRLDTDDGFFLVSVQAVVPYLTGYKIMLKIGNPLSVSYSGFKAKVKWGKAYNYSQYSKDSYDAWQKSVQEREISLADRLEAGTWNKVELIVTPATAEQLDYVNLSLSTSTVRLYEK